MNAYQLFKSLAFRLDAEKAHHLGIQSLSRFPNLMAKAFSHKEQDKFKVKISEKMNWSFPVGLAAGLDKNAEAIDFFSQLLFGAIEVGTVTPKAQEGNPKPRMFRFKEEESLLNRMGFNNSGMEEIFKNIQKSNAHNKCLGVNLGKNKLTPSEKAGEDYQALYQKFSPLSDYLVLNVSSPNTPGLRDLARKDSLIDLFDSLEGVRRERPKPLYLKISPDMAVDDLDDIIKVAIDYKMDGIIATNTTIMADRGKGGVSGRLLSKKSQLMRKELLTRLQGESSLHVIGVGGISSFDEILNFWRDGGKAVQVYSSFIYQGPQLLDDIAISIEALLNEHQFQNVEEMIKQAKYL